jgi:hypothetical protein
VHSTHSMHITHSMHSTHSTHSTHLDQRGEHCVHAGQQRGQERAPPVPRAVLELHYVLRHKLQHQAADLGLFRGSRQGVLEGAG